MCIFDVTKESIEKGVKIVEESEEIAAAMKVAQKAVQRKRKDERDLLYWVNEVLEGNTVHLLPEESLYMNSFQLADIDVHFVAFAIIIAVLWIIWKVVKTLVCCLCCTSKKNTTTKPKTQ